MEIDEVNADDRVKGRVRATYASAATSCSLVWEQLTGVQKGERVSAQYDLGGRCGKVVLDLVIDPKKDNLLSGTYVSEFPGSGTIRLKKQ